MQAWQIGRVRITKIVEIESTGGSRFILPEATPEACRSIAWMKPHFMDEQGRLRMSVHALVVDTPSRRIVVDTCIGNDKRRTIPTWNEMHGPFLRDLEDAGFPVESVDAVLCTHLHVDHVGWNTRLVDGRWVPTFPRARYVMAESEFLHWQRQQEDRMHRDVFDDSVQPIFDAGLVDLVATDHRLCAEVCLTPTAGHSPGHVSVRIESEGERAIITGDFLHHPCQLAHPEWSSSADFAPAVAIETRRRVFEELEGKPTLVIGTHFAGATAGRIERDGAAHRLVTS